MAEGIVSSIFNINNNTGSEKVSKDIIESEASSFNRKKQVKPTLTSAEQKRTTNIADIIANVFFEKKKKETKDTALETKISEQKKDTPATAAQQTFEKGKDKKGGLGALGTLALIAAAVTAFSAFIYDKLSPIGQFLMKSIKFLRPVINKIAKVVKNVFKFFTTIGDDLVKFLGKGGGMLGNAGKALGGIGRFLGGLAKGIGAKILKFARFIPVLGSFVSFGFAIAKFRSGDYFGAILELVSGILNLIPTGVTQIISGIIDGFILARELMGEGEGGGYKMDEKLKSGGGFLADIFSSIGNFISTKLRNFPIIGGIILMYEGAMELLSGNFINGFKLFGKGLLAWIAGEAGADLIINGFGFILSLFKDISSGDTEISFPSFDTIGDIIFNIGSIIGNWFTGMITSVKEWFGSVKDWFVDLFTFEGVDFPSLDDIFDFFGGIKDFLFDLPGKAADFIGGAARKAVDAVDNTMESIPVVGGLYSGAKSLFGFGGGDEEEIDERVEEVAEAVTEPLVTESKLADVMANLSSKSQIEILTTVVDTLKVQLDTIISYSKITSTNTGDTVKAIKNIKIGSSSVMPLAGGSSSGSIDSSDTVFNSRTDYSLSPYSLNVPST